MRSRFTCVLAVSTLTVGQFFGPALAANAEETKDKEGYTKQKFLSAAFNNCSTVQNRAPESCNCEQKLIDGDRRTDDDKEMAYYYWTDRARFRVEFEKRRAAEPGWQKAFSDRFTNLQALVMAACTRR